ncbi:MAG: hypothetical protein JW959_14315 [Pirellulales bacterium]|nr:hypothetical protein [Pirellulales bacterium]
MRTSCPHCQALVVQARNRDGPNFCPNCHRLFEIEEDHQVPSWIYGVLLFLTINLYNISSLHAH